MKLSILIIIAATILFLACGRTEPASNTSQASAAVEPSPPKPCINLNAATERELMTLAGVGEVMARKIVEYREQNGPFRRPQDIIIIDGFSERKYRAISDRICV
ncbi:MAG TPA: helix-hairpin-helix domain-containing protein [Blastocatellia bacterium]|nr:helix-hairpin-helix domain-containing protein [Blastocatellia bacterium]